MDALAVSDSGSILPQAIDFDPSRGLDDLLKDVPAKWVVYLMADESDRPVQLLCVKNLRYSLKRRLGEDAENVPSKRVDYRQIVRRIYWRRVFSAFEADVVYLEAARKYFPQTYRGMTGFWPAWFIHINPDANFPRYTKTIDLSIKTGLLIGPVQDKHAAARLMENVVDLFDLCRYYNILVESPNALACAYKQMGKCPAPCDGSISMDQYRYLIEWSARTLVSPAELIADGKMRMQQAAAALKFESAAKIKQYVDSLSELGKGPFRHARPLRDFKFLSMQSGPRKETAKVFLITPGEIQELIGLIGSPDPAEVLRYILALAAARHADSLDTIGAERVAVVCQHLFRPKTEHQVFLPLDSIDEKSIMKAFRDVQKQATEEVPEQSEGVVKELQAM